MTKEKEDKDLAPFVVFEGTAWEAGLLKSILEDNEIETIIDQVMSLPWNVIPTTGARARVFVAYKDYAEPFGGHLAQHLKEGFGLLRSEDARWLIHYEDPGVTIESLQYLHFLHR